MEAGDRPQAPPPLFPQNPGFQEEWTRKLKDVFPVPQEGAKVSLTKYMSSRFQLGHTLNLGDSGGGGTMPGASMGPPPYSFQATCVGKAEHDDLVPVMMAEIDNSGSLNGQIMRNITNRIRCKAVLQTQKSKWAMTQSGLEFKGNSYSASLMAINPDLIACSGILATSFLKRLTKNLIVGCDFTVHNSAAQLKASSGVSGKYTGTNWEAFGIVNSGGFQTGFYRDCSKTTAVGVEWECSAIQGESTVSLGYKIDVPEPANFTFRGSIDSTGTVSAVYEKRVHPFMLSLSGSMNHLRGLSKFGFGLSFG